VPDRQENRSQLLRQGVQFFEQLDLS
jgi:hypothetical protein